ncbi:hypothetical protein [Leptospira noguchii]|uniref:hypothetical protein n=1 Tax=Leptospira noguchii TaxID=28182 RepID=UPI001FB69000|nr:hypothetical protein [Leptospira noguchii]UOG51770.1 hypothetical protein MAL09_14005 [Leptospira noguchii]
MALEVNSASRFYWRSTGREPVHYEICELRRRPGKLSTTPTYGSAFRESLHLSLLFAPIFLRRTHVH